MNPRLKFENVIRGTVKRVAEIKNEVSHCRAKPTQQL